MWILLWLADQWTASITVDEYALFLTTLHTQVQRHLQQPSSGPSVETAADSGDVRTTGAKTASATDSSKHSEFSALQFIVSWGFDGADWELLNNCYFKFVPI